MTRTFIYKEARSVSFSFFRPFIALLLLSFLTLPQVAAANERNSEVTPPQTKGGLTCFTIKPVDPEKGKKPLSCNDLCAEKEATCTGVQSNQGPSPSCEDGMFQGSGNCRCCKVQK
jgi:hypothetical protein